MSMAWPHEARMLCAKQLLTMLCCQCARSCNSWSCMQVSIGLTYFCENLQQKGGEGAERS